MTTGRIVRVALGLAVLSTILTVVGLALVFANGVEDTNTFWPAQVFVGIVYAWVGTRVVMKEPRNLVGWLLLVGAVLWATGLALAQYAWFAVFGPVHGLPGVSASAFIGSWIWDPGTFLFLIFLPLFFPDGHLPSRRWVPVAWILIAIVSVAVTTQAATAWTLRDDPGYMLTVDYSTSGAIADVSNFLAFLAPFVAAVSVAVRWRTSRGIRRLQIRWFATAIACTATVVILAGGLQWGGLLGAMSWLVALALPAVAIGIAILRYRLYEIDRLVSRTIAYAVVTGALVLVYLAVNLTLTTASSSVTSGNSVAVAASTLAVAAIFTPLRRRIQAIVDRRFDRARVDGERTSAAFSARLRDEVDIASVTADLRDTVSAAIKPARMGLWLRGGADR